MESFFQPQIKRKKEIYVDPNRLPPEVLKALDAKGFCSSCKRWMLVHFRTDHLVPRLIDKLLNSKPIPAFCPCCNRIVEFIPVSSEKQSGEGWRLLERLYNAEGNVSADTNKPLTVIENGIERVLEEKKTSYDFEPH